MNNKEKLYLVKLAGSIGDFFKHPAGSVGAAFSRPPAGGAAAQPKSAGSPLIQQLTRHYKHRPSVISNASYESVDGSPYKQTSSSSKLNPATYADLPTAKGGLQNIPPRPPSHPLSKQTQGIPDPKAVENTMNRMDRGMPVQLHKPYEK